MQVNGGRSDADDGRRARAARFAALGDPLRLAVVEHLAHGGAARASSASSSV